MELVGVGQARRASLWAPNSLRANDQPQAIFFLRKIILIKGPKKSGP